MAWGITDELWPHFVPLWTKMREIAPRLLLAGGYGLFLKQQWLSSQAPRLSTVGGSISPLIAIDRWKDQTPRVTNDLDFVVELDVIASPSDQAALDGLLADHGFQVVEKNARWQFEKPLGANGSVLLDFHALSPDGARDDVRVNSRRVKPYPSLGQMGIQGRVNTEAIACELHPFNFVVDGIDICIPNSVTLALMKLIAMRDRRLASLAITKSPQEREFEEKQARKHANDVSRVLAMITRDENDLASQVLEVARGTAVFNEAVQVVKEFFARGAWGTQAVAGMWQTVDLDDILRVLHTWYH